MVKACFAFFVDVKLANGGNRTAHDGHLCLPKPVDALFHVPDDAHRRVPGPKRRFWVVGVLPTTAPKTGEETVMGRVCVLVFIDDEGPVLPAQFS